MSLQLKNNDNNKFYVPIHQFDPKIDRPAVPTRGKAIAGSVPRPNAPKRVLPWVLACLLLPACNTLPPPDTATVAIAAPAGKPFLGIAFRKHPLDAYGRPGDFGYQLTRVLPDSAAAHAELRAEDIILRYDGRQVGSKDREADFSNYLAKEKHIGETLSLSILRPDTAITAQLNGKELRLHSTDDVGGLLARLAPVSELRLQVRFTTADQTSHPDSGRAQ